MHQLRRSAFAWLATVAIFRALPAVAAPPARTPLTVVLVGDPVPTAEVRRGLSRAGNLPVDVRFVALPNDPAETAPPSEIEARLAEARRDYVEANFGHCLQVLSGESWVRDLLLGGNRSVAARLLFWRVACNQGSGAAEAQRDATTLAVLELDVPSEVDAVSPEVERLLQSAARTVIADGRTPVVITTDAGRASVAIDGRRAVCATPCTVDLYRGDHVLRIEADGFEPEDRTVRVDATRLTVALKARPAAAQLAARQWTARYAAAPERIDSAASVRLLARAVGARRLVVLTAQGNEKVGRLQAVLSVDGAVAAAAQRSARLAEIGDQAPALLRDVLVLGKVVEPSPPIYEKPLFWVAVGTVALAAAGVTALAFYYDPPIMTTLEFP